MKSESWKEERELLFSDIISCAITAGEKTRPIIELIKLMRAEMRLNTIGKGNEKLYLDYMKVFRLFVRHRKLKLLRYLFSLNQEFPFTVELFQIAIEEDAYDVASLMHREFGPMLRELIDQAEIPIPDGNKDIKEAYE
jgi:hypothetical protein